MHKKFNGKELFSCHHNITISSSQGISIGRSVISKCYWSTL